MVVAKKYFTGKPCCRGHICERYEAGGHCVQCEFERGARWRRQRGATPLAQFRAEAAARKIAHLADREGLRAQWRAAWHRRDKSKRVRPGCTPLAEYRAMLSARKATRLAAKEAAREPRKRWPSDPAELREYRRIYMRAWKKRNRDKVRARKKASGKRLRAYLFKLQRGRCAICGTRLGKAVHVDHIIPLSRGGLNARSNLQLTHPACNISKAAKDPLDHARALGRLV